MLSRRLLRLLTPLLCKHKLQLGSFSNTNFAKCQRIKNTYLIDENNVITSESCSVSSKFTSRTHNCGELRIENVGERVTLCGWLEYQRLNKFLTLRDGYGHTQFIIEESDTKSKSLLQKLSFESILEISGTVLSRPENMINQQDPTGEIEVLIDSLTVVNKAQPKLPFNIREFQKAKEALRMQYRYIDLRFPEMQRNMRVRSKLFADMRNFLINECNFVEVETPTLFKATPGGAQEFIVPTRIPGQVYSLVQSPQQFKQMLMAGAIDRYFQIARCYRDEGSRPDRQPEFTQLDIELSFTTSSGVMSLIEQLFQSCWPEFLQPLPAVFPRMTYKDAMEQYGTDKPDTRADFKLQNCGDVMENYESAYALVFQAPYSNVLTRSVKESLQSLRKQHTSSTDFKFIIVKITDYQSWVLKTSQILGETVAENLGKKLNLANPSVIFLGFGSDKYVLPLLGQVRLEYLNFIEAQGHKVKKESTHPLWITDFPLFEEDCGRLKTVHHPFTAPHPDDLHLLESTPLKVRSQAYDLVINGNEVGGGSIRIHDPDLQRKILKMLEISQNGLQHMLDMLGSGCPPHGGIALGLDRLLATMLQTPSIRDVIAFPKTFEGRDLVSGAPSPISEEDKRLYHIDVCAHKT